MSVDPWMVGSAANATISAAYLTIAALIFLGLIRSHQLSVNWLGTATGAIFLSCGIGHGVHFYHSMIPLWTPGSEVGIASRIQLGDWHMWTIDGITALVGVWYVSLRRRFPALTRSALMFDDVRMRMRQALEIHDNVVQALVRAKLALELGRREESESAMEEALHASRIIVDDLLRKMEGTTLRPGDLQRGAPPGRGPS